MCAGCIAPLRSPRGLTIGLIDKIADVLAARRDSPPAPLASERGVLLLVFLSVSTDLLLTPASLSSLARGGTGGGVSLARRGPRFLEDLRDEPNGQPQAERGRLWCSRRRTGWSFSEARTNGPPWTRPKIVPLTPPSPLAAEDWSHFEPRNIFSGPELKPTQPRRLPPGPPRKRGGSRSSRWRARQLWTDF